MEEVKSMVDTDNQKVVVDVGKLKMVVGMLKVVADMGMVEVDMGGNQVLEDKQVHMDLNLVVVIVVVVVDIYMDLLLHMEDMVIRDSTLKYNKKQQNLFCWNWNLLIIN